MRAPMVGRTPRVRIVEVTRPPMTTEASGRCTSAPAPDATAIGTNPTAATSAVVRTGRNLERAAARAASIGSSPAARRSRSAATSTLLFKVATPKSASRPTTALTDTGRSRAASARMPPLVASGTVVSTTSAERPSPKER